ncbi:MAG TPA: tail fiber protein [Acidimicrobiales bacterium]|jgi:microcystin-dependent protein|nr:tail fiber protein [Acidimicrobiales bacterium]
MTDQYLGEIRVVGFNFAPLGWAMCNGQVMPITQNTALFSLLGTQFGGDGKSNFALPNLQGSTPLDQGSGTGLTVRSMGDVGGETQVTLLSSQMPSHGHPAQAVAAAGNQVGPSANLTAEVRADSYAPVANGQMSPSALHSTGGGQPHNNLPPYLVLNFVIALTGIFPARS